MFKLIPLLLVSLLLFSGCEFFDDVQDIENAKNVEMSTAYTDIKITVPAGDFNPSSSLSTNLSNYSFKFTYALKADNSKNSDQAQIGKVALDVVADTANAEPIAVSGSSMTLPGGVIDTLLYYGQGTAADNRIAMRYFVDKTINTRRATVTATGTYTVTIAGLDVDLEMPDQQASFTPDADVRTRQYLRAAFDAGVFDQ